MNFKNITTHYMDSRHDGVRVCKIDNSPMQVIVVPNGMLKEAKALSEDLPGQHGVYFLIEQAEEAGLAKMYAGQTTNGLGRLDDHKANKKWWDYAVMFLADDSHFQLDVISALEKLAIEAIEKSCRYDSENKKGQKYKVSPFLKQTVELYFNDIKFVMATMGCDLSPNETAFKGEWHIKRRGIVAYGNRTANGFEVLPGSQIEMSRTKIQQTYLDRRGALLKSRDIAKDSSGRYVLKKVIPFKTPSGASDFVIGSATNGWVEWVNDNGEPLDILRK